MGLDRGVVVISKLMSLTFQDFLRSVAVLEGDGPDRTTAMEKAVRLPAGGGFVDIQFEKLEDVRLGGLLALPRARVSLRFWDVPENEIKKFVARFDMAFQRGGG